ncbi:DUF3102 domain-containing protein [Acaryochloris sp. CCMEE 5410]|uniref:DUF3102 domain-containing protein n=1 Tax=Acaryochloris sp. CCMEE 5410 TaxID=310037 RepID=UPI000248522F|nr:DUF3102 domain-containing protein [Acaryochloris sp. CCMEE 5410]KAI9130171.1 DUF3102 domain-containing protein [Acaryochloris sp. CCMEE 5410]
MSSSLNQPKTTNSIKSGLFEYDSLDKETRKFLLKQTNAIKAVYSRTRQDAYTVGKILLEAQAKLERGTFCQWIKCEFNGSPSTAYNQMHLAEAFDFATLTSTDLPLTILYELARPTVSEETREAVLALAEKEKLSRHRVKEIIAQQNKRIKQDEGIEATTATIDIPSIEVKEVKEQPTNLILFKRKTKGSAELLLEVQSVQIKTIQKVCSELVDYFSGQEASAN